MPAETEKTPSPAQAAPAAPAGEVKLPGSKRMLFIGIGAVALVAVIVLLVMMGGKEGDKKKNNGNGGGDSADQHPGAGGAKLPLGAQIVIPEMTFEMNSTRAEYPLFRLSAVLVLKKSDMAKEDPQIQEKEMKVEEGVLRMIPWIQQQVTNIIRNIPPEDRDQLLYEEGARRFADELKSIVNKRFKGEFQDDVVEEVWLPVRRPVYQ